MNFLHCMSLHVWIHCNRVSNKDTVPLVTWKSCSSSNRTIPRGIAIEIDCFGDTISTMLEHQFGLLDYTVCFGSTNFGCCFSHLEFGRLFRLHRLGSWFTHHNPGWLFRNYNCGCCISHYDFGHLLRYHNIVYWLRHCDFGHPFGFRNSFASLVTTLRLLWGSAGGG